MKSRSWIVLANREKAKIYRIVKVGHLEEVASFTHPDHGTTAKDFLSDRPGRSFDKMGGGRHAVDLEETLDEKKCIHFAHLLANFLITERESGDFEHLYIAAENKFLGYIRKHWPKDLLSHVEESFPKDIVSKPLEEVWELLPLTV